MQVYVTGTAFVEHYTSADGDDLGTAYNYGDMAFRKNRWREAGHEVIYSMASAHRHYTLLEDAPYESRTGVRNSFATARRMGWSTD